MGARKLYEEKIQELIKKVPEEKLSEVISLIEKLNQDKQERHLEIIKQSRGMFKDVLPSTEEFIKRKQQEKLLDK